MCTLKEDKLTKIITPKARLVARGFEEEQVKDIPKDAPTCSSESLRVIISVIAQKKWKVNTMDISTAFLQGSEMKRDIFIKPPKEASANGNLWKLNKCVYGLCDASLSWYHKVCEIMDQCGVTKSKVDPAVFYWLNNNEVCGVLACHVDDFLWAGDKCYEESVIQKIRENLLVGQEHTEDDGAFAYVGIEIKNVQGSIHLSQKEYINSMKTISLDGKRAMEKESPLTFQEKDELQSKIGQILWVARQSRPDVIFDASKLASEFKDATINTVLQANKIIKHLKSETVELRFQHLENDIDLVIFSDSSLGNLCDGGTQGGQFILLRGKSGMFSPLTWQSKRIRRVARSTLAAETLALADAIDNGVFLCTLFNELTCGLSKPENLKVTCITDNHSLFDAMKSTKHVSEKRLRLDINGIKEFLQTSPGNKIVWVETCFQLADCLTKKRSFSTSTAEGLT